MKRLFRLLCIVTLLLMTQSCISFNTTGLNNLSQEQKDMIVRPTKPLEQLAVNDSIYVINDSMVKDWLADKEYAVVHSYLTWCKGDYCINPEIVVNNLRETELPFLMVAGDLESKNGYYADYPFMCIDFDYYKTKNYSKGIEKMFRALGCGDNWWNLYFLFHGGEYMGSAETLADIMKIIKSE